MANIKPFKALRPAANKIHLVASRSVDNYPREELNLKLESNPYSFLHIINPDFSDGKRTKPGSLERLLKIKSRFLDFVAKEIFIQDKNPSYYLYQQIKDDNVYNGIIGCSAAADYENGVIKIHEHTLPEREEKLKEYLEVCNFNSEPVLFCYENIAIIDELINDMLLKQPVYDYSTTDTVRHKLWVIGEKKSIELIQTEFAKLNSIYIADGHHRSASSSKLAKERVQNNKNNTGLENYNYYLGIFFSQNQLKIFDFNRIVTDLNGLTTTEFILKLKKSFKITNHNKNIYKPEQANKFSMYLDGNWYELTAKSFILNTKNHVKRLGASILSNHILSPFLGIKDVRSDKRINFIPGIKGMEELKRMVDTGKFKIAFGLFPVTMPELQNIANTNNIMPPKTTWIEPKIRSGLVVYSLTED